MAGSITKKRGYPIGEMSRLTGVNIETIRYYERIGIMPEPDRSPGGNRQYDNEHLKRLFFIKRSRELGFSIEEIRALLAMVDSREYSCADVNQMTVAHLSEVQSKIADLKKLESALEQMAAECSRGDIPECPIVETLFELPTLGDG
ncbi:MAG: helix-turn-helix domain-containing protein [Pseudomonadota bacterium]